ncbi:hypothetical protein [Ornithinimicrobium sp. INDO-MA30-4]|uniref:hypothetical protein n=1 Tax=Ornithinimicrobium sp. INDO-MA30-4 TaxID=2908651 RepID=UPI001F17930A|nr:hypothetical protein [Ornithinimicrobium sp. INDO-MA30-4]UJH70981.1 hypothetical protein L0A91_03285 [Ornithinimicrobium sp. INDO-MA30-4]
MSTAGHQLAILAGSAAFTAAATAWWRNRGVPGDTSGGAGLTTLARTSACSKVHPWC